MSRITETRVYCDCCGAEIPRGRTMVEFPIGVHPAEYCADCFAKVYNAIIEAVGMCNGSEDDPKGKVKGRIDWFERMFTSCWASMTKAGT